MTDVIYVGGKSVMITRAEGSNTTTANYGVYNSGGTDDKLIQLSELSVNAKNNMIKRFTIGGGRNYKQIIPGKYEIDGSMTFDIQNGNFLRYVVGTTTSGTQATVNFDGATITSGTAALKKYVVSEADVLDSFTADVYNMSDGSTDIKHRISGVKLNQISVKADTENPLSLSADFIGQTSVVTTGILTPTIPLAYSDVPAMFYKGTLLIGTGDFGSGTGSLSTMTDSTKAWTIDQWKTNFVVIDSAGSAFPIASNTATALTVTGTPATGSYVITPLSTYTSDKVIQCNSVDMTLNNNLEKYWSISNDTGRGIKFGLEKQRDYELKLDLNFTNTDQLARFFTGITNPAAIQPATTSDISPFSIQIGYKTAVGTDADKYKEIRFVYNDVVFDTTELPLNPSDIVKQTFTAFAKKCTVFYITAETV